MKKFFSNKKIRITFISCFIVIILVAISVTAMQMVAKNSSIGVKAAKKFALIDAGVKERKTKNMSVDFTYRDSTYVYDVEFEAKKQKYSYFIKASNGIILEKKVVKIKDTSKKHKHKKKENKKDKKSKKKIETENKEQKNKKKKSNINQNNVKKNHKKNSKHTENEDEQILNETTKKVKSANDKEEKEDNLISVDDAKSIALGNAGVNPSEATFTMAQLQKVGDSEVFEVHFYAESHEFIYRINARTGSVVSASSHSVENANEE